jgi:hypothetical protein
VKITSTRDEQREIQDGKAKVVWCWMGRAAGVVMGLWRPEDAMRRVWGRRLIPSGSAVELVTRVQCRRG